MWDYKTVVLQSSAEKAPSAHDVDDTLNTYGKLGFQIVHLKERVDGTYFVILARDTGRPIQEEEDQKDWLVDVVSSPESALSGR
jgi:hypothetical protein